LTCEKPKTQSISVRPRRTFQIVRIESCVIEKAATLPVGPWRLSVARRRTAAALNHALEFATWRSLTGKQLSNREAANLMVELVAAARVNKRQAGS
jgi:hypothetical protein